ncbi:hypothetical protein [Planctomycetes bacterium CA13]|uniref:hypothetical protein n=1 Tax=Novipirellula herctigrandis TaxID=2527986 RepID=UPI0011B59018
MNRRDFFVLASSVWCLASTRAIELFADEDTDEGTNRDDEEAIIETIDLSELSEPPPAIAELIESAKVRFILGPQEKATTQKRLRTRALGKGRKTAGLTEYRVSYRFRSYNRWNETIDGRSDKEVTVTAKLFDLGIDHSHTVWLLQRPSAETFWTDRVVLHELDHVRISSDPMLEKRFVEKVQSKLVFTTSIGVDERYSSQKANRIVKQHIADTFEEIAELIEIRYQELDRLTDHGLNELPPNSSLDSVLR